MLWSNTATMADAGDVGGRNVLGSVSKAKAIPKSGDAASPPNPSENEQALARQKQLYSLFAGGFAGAVASSITCPIEVVKTQLQSSRVGGGSNPFRVAREILAADGFKGFFRGLPPTLVGIIPARATYFWAYSTSKQALMPSLGDSTLTHILSGIAAGVTGNTITNPIWMVKTRMQLMADGAVGQMAYTSYRNAITRIYREEGLKGFWKGLSASYWGCSEGCIQFVVYEKLKKQLLVRNNDKRRAEGLEAKEDLPPTFTLAAAAFSKFVATTTTYPHEVVRTRLREQARNGAFKYRSMWQSLRLIAKEEGRRGLYAGMGTHVARVVPNTAIMFLSFELVNSFLGKRFAEKQQAQDAAQLVGDEAELGFPEPEED
ncbi:hypothetical protein NSK_000188 [Nannochloropsis salina CCMP1776]|uniref:Mitochondrial carrier protein n=1 Tax=Nannochloropsis salina CCMP1776 TaxID=1027361 RepID=A0A4D9DIC9_9STRA|nr:hypothetical protein NSK_000188 [Nannochloropsis salina CCMP1776]|eukprot:TFJ88619.1 hypothetical protein NSK_000188 [Nannochloropsis salina CCMP1776]